MRAGVTGNLLVAKGGLLPGVLDTFASEFCPVSMLIREDFPTLERPITANSGNLGFGHCSSLTLLLTYTAVFTRTCRDGQTSDVADELSHCASTSHPQRGCSETQAYVRGLW